MFGFIKKVFFTGLTNLSNLLSITPLRCISMTSPECKVRPEIVMLIVMTLYPFSIKTSKCSGSCKKLKC